MVTLPLRAVTKWFVGFLICLVLLGLAHHAWGAERRVPLPSDTERTASWYQANPTFMRRILAACRNDPGHAWNNPDCMNARAGEFREAEALARRSMGGPGRLIPPTNPRYWTENPAELPERLARCRMMRPEDQRAYFCDAARAAAGNRVAGR